MNSKVIGILRGLLRGVFGLFWKGHRWVCCFFFILVVSWNLVWKSHRIDSFSVVTMVSPWRKPKVPVREVWYVPVRARHRVPVAGADAHEQDWAKSQAVQGQRNLQAKAMPAMPDMAQPQLSAGKARQAIGAAPVRSTVLLSAIGAAPPKPSGAPTRSTRSFRAPILVPSQPRGPPPKALLKSAAEVLLSAAEVSKARAETSRNLLVIVAKSHTERYMTAKRKRELRRKELEEDEFILQLDEIHHGEDDVRELKQEQEEGSVEPERKRSKESLNEDD